MNTELLQRIKNASHRVHRSKAESENQFLSGLKAVLASRGHRADLALSTDARDTQGSFSASVRFDATLGYPTENHLLTLVAQAYPTHDIAWDMAQVDSESGIVILQLEPAMEVIPLASLDEIPAEFKPIGTGLYKRAVDASERVHEIWTLKGGDDGLMLYRNNDDLEIVADEEGFKAGDVVNTPEGVGKIVRFDEIGNAFVQIGNQKRLIAGSELRPYDINKEKKKLEDYYAEAFGSRDLATSMVEDFATRQKKRK